jgi:hypothetical protein
MSKRRYTEAQIIAILKELESENSQMERFIARQHSRSERCPRSFERNGCGPARKEAVRAQQTQSLSQRQACRL